MIEQTAIYKAKTIQDNLNIFIYYLFNIGLVYMVL